MNRKVEEAMWERTSMAVLIILVAAALLGAGVGVWWRAEYGQCLAMPGGIHKILDGTCAASLP
jgi:hypothetical protein